MNGIIQGKQEKQAGSLVWKKVAEQESYGNGYRVLAPNIYTLFRIEDVDGNVIFGNKTNFKYTVFSQSSFSGNTNTRIAIEFTDATQNRNMLVVNDVNNNYNIQSSFKSIEIGYFE